MHPAKTTLSVLCEAPTNNAARTAPIAGQSESIGTMALEIEVVSDVICPWCYVGKRRLEKAIAMLGPDAKVTVMSMSLFQIELAFQFGDVEFDAILVAAERQDFIAIESIW